MAKGENALVEWLTQRFVADGRRVVLGIGDDMAVVRFDGTLVAVTTDMLLDGVHFDTHQHGYDLIGRKAMACSLSDCAGMACEPRVATVSIALCETMSLDDVKQLYEGMAGIGDEYGCAIVGGDTTSWSGRLVIDVAMLAEPMSQGGVIKRSDARVGDTIFVSGTLGGSLAGKHMSFEPRLDLARRLVKGPGLHAMMDLSDGLAMDLHRLCVASGCDAELMSDELDRVTSNAARASSQADGRSPLDHALADGEDFELLVVGDGGVMGEDVGLIAVGRIVARVGGEATMTICDWAGGRETLEPRGYEHFR